MIPNTYNRLFIASAEILKKDSEEITPTEVANLLGISQQLMNNWKNRGVPASKLKGISKALDVTEEWLKTGTEQNISSLSSSGESIEIDDIDPVAADKKSQGLVNSVISRLITFLNGIWSKSDKSTSYQLPLSELEIQIMDIVKKSGYRINRVPRIYGINIDRWAKLTFVVEHNNEMAFLSLIPKNALPTNPDDTDEFIYIKESKLNQLDKKLHKRFGDHLKLQKFKPTEHYDELDKLIKISRQSNSKKVHTLLQLAEIPDIEKIPSNKLVEMIKLLKT